MPRKTVTAGGKNTLTLPTSSADLAKICRDVGWRVDESSLGFRISNGFAPPVMVSKNLGGRNLPNAHRALERLGLLTAWAEKIEADERIRQEKIDADRRRNANLLEDMKHQAETRTAPPPPPTDPKEIFVAPATRTAPKSAPAKNAGKKADLEPYSEYVEVTPEQAEEWYTRALPWRSNGERLNQRPVNDGWVNDLSIMMKTPGRWRKIHQGIALAPEEPHNTGGVCDGQHRLLAIMKAGKPAILNVNYNADPDNFVVFDTQRTRTGAQTLAIGGHKNSFLLSSTLKLLWLYDAWEADPEGDFPGEWWEWNRHRFPNDLNEVMLEKHPTIEHDVTIANPFKNKPYNFSASAVAVLHYKARQTAPWVHNDKFDPHSAAAPGFNLDKTDDDLKPGPLDVFMFKLRFGFGLAGESAHELTTDPAVSVRNWLVKGMQRRVVLKNDDGSMRNVPGREVTLLKLTAAYNKAIRGEPLKLVKVNADEGMIRPGIPAKRLW